MKECGAGIPLSLSSNNLEWICPISGSSSFSSLICLCQSIMWTPCSYIFQFLKEKLDVTLRCWNLVHIFKQHLVCHPTLTFRSCSTSRPSVVSLNLLIVLVSAKICQVSALLVVKGRCRESLLVNLLEGYWLQGTTRVVNQSIMVCLGRLWGKDCMMVLHERWAEFCRMTRTLPRQWGPLPQSPSHRAHPSCLGLPSCCYSLCVLCNLHRGEGTLETVVSLFFFFLQ